MVEKGLESGPLELGSSGGTVIGANLGVRFRPAIPAIFR